MVVVSDQSAQRTSTPRPREFFAITEVSAVAPEGNPVVARFQSKVIECPNRSIHSTGTQPPRTGADTKTRAMDRSMTIL